MNIKSWLKNFNKTNFPNALNKKVLKAYNITRQKTQKEYLCHAPFKSMLLANNGRVLACCFNRQAVLGEYPQQSLKDIWFGEQAKILRQHIAHYDMSNGCFICKNQLLNNEFSTVKAKMFDHLIASTSGYPATIEFDLDNICNLECIMCNADNSSSIRSKSDLYGSYKSPYDAALVKELELFIPHLQQASFAGGEPFLIKLYYDIWEKMIALKPEIRINITTNATILNEKIKALLNRGNFEISVSLDTINEANYSQIRKNADFKTVMENLLYYHDYCKSKETFFGIWACPLRSNRYDIPDLFNFFGEKDIEVFLHTVWVPPKVTLWNLSAQELQKLHFFYKKQILKEDSEIQLKNKLRFQEFINLIKSWQIMAELREQKKIFLQSPAQNEDNLFQIIEQQYAIRGFEVKSTATKMGEQHQKRIYCRINLPQPIYNNALIALNEYPDEFIFQIFEAGSKEMICDFFKYLVR